MFSFMSGAKVVSLLLLAGATVCFGLGPSRPDPQTLGGCVGCIDRPTVTCGDVLDESDPNGQNHCCGNLFGLCNSGEGGDPYTTCEVSEHHCSGLSEAQSPFCETLYQGACH
jgi:hypothetical protein